MEYNIQALNLKHCCSGLNLHGVLLMKYYRLFRAPPSAGLQKSTFLTNQCNPGHSKLFFVLWKDHVLKFHLICQLQMLFYLAVMM